MSRALDAIATTNFVLDADIEKGFEGSGMETEDQVAFPPTCTFSVESHEADTTSECSLQ